MTSSTSVKNMSLYIPYVVATITEEMISYVFLYQKIGKVKRVDLVPKLDGKGEYYHCAFIHFEYWFDNIITSNIQKRLQNVNVETRIVYDDPWFWVIKENKSGIYSNEQEEAALGSGLAYGSAGLGRRHQRLNILI
jgi:hypothetical protein